MDIETLLRSHAAGAFEQVFALSNKSQVVRATSVREEDTGPVENRRYAGPCHACVNREILRPSTFAVITESDPTLVENEGAILFYDWLINRSFFSDVFLCKDPVLSLRYGFVKSTNVNAARWLGAAQLSRLATSEYKLSAKAIYDILSSGFKIHPLLLVLLATNLGWSTNGRAILSKKTISNYSMHCAGLTHLPMIHFHNEELLKEACIDSPNKPTLARFSNENPQTFFKHVSWSQGSNSILTVAPQSNGEMSRNLYLKLEGMFPGNNKGSSLFGKVEGKLDYTCFWPKAVKELQKSYRPSSEVAGGREVYLEPLVTLTKQLNLGN